MEDSLDVHLVEHEKRKRILRRGSKAAPKLPNFHNVSPSDSRKIPDADDESSIGNVDDITPQIENLKMNRNRRQPLVNKKAFMSELDKIRRAPTPMKQSTVENAPLVIADIVEVVTNPADPVKQANNQDILSNSKEPNENNEPLENLTVGDEDDDDDVTPQIEKLKMNRKSVGNKTAFLSALDKIQRAPTPMKEANSVEVEPDFRRAAPEVDAAVMAEEADFSFHPNIESTRAVLSTLDKIQRTPTPMKEANNVEGEPDFCSPTPETDATVMAEKADFSFHPNVESTRAVLSTLDKIQRTPTPMKEANNVEGEPDFCRATPETDATVIAEEADFSFHPNVESTRVGSKSIFSASAANDYIEDGENNDKEVSFRQVTQEHVTPSPLPPPVEFNDLAVERDVYNGPPEEERIEVVTIQKVSCKAKVGMPIPQPLATEMVKELESDRYTHEETLVHNIVESSTKSNRSSVTDDSKRDEAGGSNHTLDKAPTVKLFEKTLDENESRVSFQKENVEVNDCTDAIEGPTVIDSQKDMTIQHSSKIVEKSLSDNRKSTSTLEEHMSSAEEITLTKPSQETSNVEKSPSDNRKSTSTLEEHMSSAEEVTLTKLSQEISNANGSRVSTHEEAMEVNESTDDKDSPSNLHSPKDATVASSSKIVENSPCEDRKSKSTVEEEHMSSDEEVTVRRISQEHMPPPPLPPLQISPSESVEKSASRDVEMLNSILTPLEDEVNETLVNRVMEETKKIPSRNRKPKRGRTRESYSDNFCGTAKVLWKVFKKIATPNILSGGIEWLETHTNKLPPQPGDFKDLLERFEFIPADDPRNQNLYEVLDSVLDDEELYQVMPMAIFDGTPGGGSTLRKDFWEQRAWL